MNMILTSFSINFSFFTLSFERWVNGKRLQNLHAVLLAINR